MKRFIETTKWDDLWFRKLSPTAKLFWDYITTKCDQAGVIDLDEEAATFYIGLEIKWVSLKNDFDGRIEVLPNGKLFIVGFIEFQYGKLSEDCKPHVPVYRLLEKHGLSLDLIAQKAFYKETVTTSLRNKILQRDNYECAYLGIKLEPQEAVVDHVIPRSKGGQAVPENLVACRDDMNRLKGQKSLEEFCIQQVLDLQTIKNRISERIQKPLITYPIGFRSLQEKEKEKEEEREKEKEILKAFSLRINVLFNRRDSTEWSDKEKSALKALSKRRGFDEEMVEIEKYYRTDSPTLRHDIQTLLNNWSGELDRARSTRPKTQSFTIQKPAPVLRPEIV